MSCPTFNQFISALFGLLFRAFFAASSKFSFEVESRVYQAFSTLLKDATLICLSFSDLDPQSALLLAAAANTNFAHSQFLSTTRAALAIPTAIKCSRLASEVIASFIIAEALLLQDESSIHC